MFGTESLQGSEYPGHVRAGQFESVAEQTGEQIHVRSPRRREAVHPVAQLHQLQQGGVLRSLSVRVVYLQDQVLDRFGVKVHAVPKQLHAVHFHVADVAGRLRVLGRLTVQSHVPGASRHSRRVPDVTPQVEMNCLKKGFPPVSKSQRPIVAVQGDIQLGLLPVRISILTYGHGPALRMAATKWIDKQRQCWLQTAVFADAELQSESKENVNTVGLDPVAFEGEQHPLPPGGVEPGVDAHVVAHKHCVEGDARVPPLQQEAQLQILQVSVTFNSQVRISGVGHGGPAGSLNQTEARVTAGASSLVLCRAGGTAGPVPHRAGDETLAGRVIVGAGAAAALVAVNTDLLVLSAIQHGESVAQPEV